MGKSQTAVRALHDVGAAAWFGGALMGAVAMNGASRDISDPRDRARMAANGWARWAPVSAAAIAAHLAGGAGLVLNNRGRVRAQSGVTANTTVKTILTACAIATTAYSGVLGARILSAGPVPAEGGTVPSQGTPPNIASAQRQLRPLQWLTPAFTAAVIVLGAQQGEQQRPARVAKGLARRAMRA